MKYKRSLFFYLVSLILCFTLVNPIETHALRIDEEGNNELIPDMDEHREKLNEEGRKIQEHRDASSLFRPKLKIDGKGKVDVYVDGEIKSKGTLVTEFIDKYRVVIAGISGIGAISMILFFILGFIRLGATSANPEERSKTIMGLILSGIGAAGLGAVTFITGIFYNAL